MLACLPLSAFLLRLLSDCVGWCVLDAFLIHVWLLVLFAIETCCYLVLRLRILVRRELKVIVLAM